MQIRTQEKCGNVSGRYFDFYVDDLVILGFTEDGVHLVQDKLRFLLNLTKLGDIIYYLGVRVTFE